MSNGSGYDPSAPGLDEARLDAYRSLLISHLDMLNVALMRDGLLTSEVTAEMVEIGDSLALWNSSAGAVRIRITGGAGSSAETIETGFDASLEMGVVGCSGFRYTFYTYLTVYLHPDALASRHANEQAEARERLLSRVSDWITLGVCNNWDPSTESGGLVVPLSSHVLSAPPATDCLLDSHVHRGWRSLEYRGFGHSQLVPALRLVVQASVE